MLSMTGREFAMLPGSVPRLYLLRGCAKPHRWQPDALSWESKSVELGPLSRCLLAEENDNKRQQRQET
jgi:hypothetical protein